MPTTSKFATTRLPISRSSLVSIRLPSSITQLNSFLVVAALEVVVVADVVKLLDLVVEALAALLIDVKLVLKADACLYGGLIVTLEIVAEIVCALLQVCPSSFFSHFH